MTFNLPAWSPVKWNLRDRGLRNFYNAENWLSPILLDEIMGVSQALRHDLLALLCEFNAIIFISGRYDKNWQEVARQKYYEWAFENLLQRIGLLAKSRPLPEGEIPGVQIIMDWPQGNDKWLFDTYIGGFYFGRGLTTRQTYFSGPLHRLNFIDSIFHGSTLHSGPLQLADLCVGCCRDFLSWAYKGTGFQKFQGCFHELVNQFYTNEKGRLNDCGFKVAKDTRIDIEAKITEYIDTFHQANENEDIPF